MIDTIDTAEFKTASKVVSMVTLGIDTIDTRDRHYGGPGLVSSRAAILWTSRPDRRPPPTTLRRPA